MHSGQESTPPVPPLLTANNSTMTPLERYYEDLKRPDFSPDPAQELAVKHTQRLYEEMLKAPAPQTSSGGWKSWFGKSKAAQSATPSLRGLYFWGGVGRGKTYLVDTFFACLPFEQKQRIHFHRFMRQVHEELKTLKEVRDPLKIVASRLAERTRIICLDEFFVADITDAMLLSGLLEALFAHGVVLIATSNTAPENLYKDGLQRDRFLPAIALLQKHLEVVDVGHGTDYRLRTLEQAHVYHCPLGAESRRIMEDEFRRLAPAPCVEGEALEINERMIPTLMSTDGIIWFDFSVLCGIPRAVSDYIELAECYNTVFLSDIPQMGHLQDDFAQRFITLVDEFYDRNVKLVISAEVPAEELYKGQKRAEPFKRTLSRLQEMASHEYLQSPHIVGTHCPH